MEMKLDDEIHTLCLIGSLPDSWETLAMSLIYFIPNGILTLKMVKVSMLNEENKRKDWGPIRQSQSLSHWKVRKEQKHKSEEPW